MIKRPLPDDRRRPLEGFEIEKLRDSLDDRQYWHRTRDILSSVSIWSVGVITAVLLVREQVVGVLRWLAKIFGGTP